MDLSRFTPRQKIAAGVVGAVLLLSQLSGPTPPAPAAGAPSAELQAAVGPVKALTAGKPDAGRALAPFYRAAADVVRRDSSEIGSTGAFRSAKIRADVLYLQKTPLVGSLPGVGAAVDKVLIDAVGLEDRPLDPATRTKLADALDAISWALEGG